MDTGLLVTLIETTIPSGVTFNACGVAQGSLRYTFTFQKLRVTFDVCALNGMWGGRRDIMTNLWGTSGPITRRDFTFTSFEECVNHLWWTTADYIERNKSNVSMEFLHFKVAMKKWFTLSSEEKLKWFKVTNIYGA